MLQLDIVAVEGSLPVVVGKQSEVEAHIVDTPSVVEEAVVVAVEDSFLVVVDNLIAGNPVVDTPSLVVEVLIVRYFLPVCLLIEHTHLNERTTPPRLEPYFLSLCRHDSFPSLRSLLQE